MIIEGVIKALKGDDDWESYFDLSARGLPLSFFAVFGYLPFYLICVKAAVQYNAVPGDVPFLAIGIILTMMALSFPIITYVMCMVFDRQDAFRPWVTVRNWTLLFVNMLMSAGFGLYLLGLLPFSVAYVVGLSVYLLTLAVDIRLAHIVARFDWMLSIFAGIFITGAAMMILLMGLTQAL